MGQFDDNTLVLAPAEILATQTKKFESEDLAYRKELFDHMLSVMNEHSGVGLSANQINFDKAVFVMQSSDGPKFMANPEIHHVSVKKTLVKEGCLSEPGLILAIKRPAAVMVSWEDENGEEQQGTFEMLESVIFQHEFDHLQGIMFTDRASDLKLKMARKKQDRLNRFWRGRIR